MHRCAGASARLNWMMDPFGGVIPGPGVAGRMSGCADAAQAWMGPERAGRDANWDGIRGPPGWQRGRRRRRSAVGPTPQGLSKLRVGGGGSFKVRSQSGPHARAGPSAAPCQLHHFQSAVRSHISELGSLPSEYSRELPRIFTNSHKGENIL